MKKIAIIIILLLPLHSFGEKLSLKVNKIKDYVVDISLKNISDENIMVRVLGDRIICGLYKSPKRKYISIFHCITFAKYITLKPGTTKKFKIDTKVIKHRDNDYKKGKSQYKIAIEYMRPDSEEYKYEDISYTFYSTATIKP